MKRNSINDQTALPKYGLIVDRQVYEWVDNYSPEETEEVRSTRGICNECDLQEYCGSMPYRFLPCLSLYDESAFEREINDRKLKFCNFKKYK